MNHNGWDNEIILIFNILLYIITLLLYLRKNSLFSLGGVVLALYAFISVVAFFLFKSPFANFKNLHLFPFIYLYVVLLLMMMPILRFKEDATENLIIARSSFVKYLSVFLVLLTFLVFIIKLQDGKSLSSMFDAEQLLQNYEDGHEDLQSMQTSNRFMMFMVIYYVLIPHIIPLFVYNIYLKNQKLSISLGLSILLSIMICLLDGSRTALLPYITATPFVYICFAKKMRNRLKKQIKKISIISISFIIFCFGSMTAARFGGDSADLLTYTLENYTGQSMLCFNNYGLDANGIRYGDRVAPVIRRLMGLKTSMNYYERRETYGKMSIDDSYFITFVGDFTLDFGPVWAFAILCFFAFMFRRLLKLRGKSYKFSQIFILYILYQWMVRGFFLWPYSEKIGNMALILGLIIYLILHHGECKLYKINNKKFNCQ